MIKYILKRWYYVLISILLFLLLRFILDLNVDIFFIMFIIYLVRIVDDLFDYNKDKGKRLDKRKLFLLMVIFSILLIIVSIINYKLLGLISIFFIIYVILMNKVEILKVFLLTLIVMFLCIIRNTSLIISLLLCIGSLLLSIIFWIVKRRKNDI